jgi:sigma-B regulation protein RsbQ
MHSPPSLSQAAVVFRNNVNVVGAGERPMIFAHGFGCDQNMWRLVAPAFQPSHTTVLFDYVGCGKSDLSAFDAARYGALDGYAQDLLDVCEALDLRQAVFVGHSVSSMIGLLAAIRQPARFSKLIMIGPSPRYLDDAPDYRGGFQQRDIEELLSVMDHNYLGWAGHFAPVIMGNPERPELAGELQASFCSTDPLAARTFARTTFFGDNRADLPKLTVPSLLLQVRDDAVVPLEVGHYLHANLPQSTLTILDATGHCPHMSHPDATIAAMKEFLA